MSSHKEKIIKDFREEIKHAYESGAKVMSADRELRFCFELQRDRLAAYFLHHIFPQVICLQYVTNLPRVYF